MDGESEKGNGRRGLLERILNLSLSQGSYFDRSLIQNPLSPNTMLLSSPPHLLPLSLPIFPNQGIRLP